MIFWIQTITTVWVLIVFLVPLTAFCEDGYTRIKAPCNLTFPGDHGEHPGYRTEWWYYTGNLRNEKGNAYGFQLTFFRHQITPIVDHAFTEAVSKWRANQIYFAHAALTDIAGKRHYSAEQIGRGALGIAGVKKDGNAIRVSIGKWQALITENKHQLHALDDAFQFELNLVPTKPLVLHGDQGYSRKGSRADQASCYYSYTRMGATGELTLGGSTFKVAGSAWMDHEFSTAPLAKGIIGWDWFALQLADQTEIMLFLLRLKNGGIHSASSGTFVDENQNVIPLSYNEFDIRPLAYWKSPKTNGNYPRKWEINVPELALVLKVTSNLADQEMVTRTTANVAYWEGSVAVEGQKDGQPVNGQGYVEMTGYANDFSAPL